MLLVRINVHACAPAAVSIDTMAKGSCFCPREHINSALPGRLLLLDAYDLEPEVGVVHAGIERMRQLQEHMWKLVADGSGWEVELARRGVLDEAALEIEWVEEHALAQISAQVEDGLCLAAITRVLVAGDVRTRFEVLDQFGNG